jgi:hypothetical protein
VRNVQHVFSCCPVGVKVQPQCVGGSPHLKVLMQASEAMLKGAGRESCEPYEVAPKVRDVKTLDSCRSVLVNGYSKSRIFRRTRFPQFDCCCQLSAVWDSP